MLGHGKLEYDFGGDLAGMLGVEHYAGAGRLLADLAALDMIADVQAIGDQFVALARCSGAQASGFGSATSAGRIRQPGSTPRAFASCCAGDRGAAVVMLSGCVKVSRALPAPRPGPPVSARCGPSSDRTGASGLGLAVPPDARADRLRPAARPDRRTGCRPGCSAPHPLGHPCRELGLDR
jgi:hypothetical protein